MHNITKYSSICKATISVIPQACLLLPLALLWLQCLMLCRFLVCLQLCLLLFIRGVCISLSQLVSACMGAYQLVLVHINCRQAGRQAAGRQAADLGSKLLGSRPRSLEPVILVEPAVESASSFEEVCLCFKHRTCMPAKCHILLGEHLTCICRCSPP